MKVRFDNYPSLVFHLPKYNALLDICVTTGAATRTFTLRESELEFLRTLIDTQLKK